MKRQIFIVVLLLLLSTCAIPQDLGDIPQEPEDMNWDELRTNAIQEIQSGAYSSFESVRVLDFKILAWYRMRDKRPWYVDNALCWGKVMADGATRWVVIHMARNPINGVSQQDQEWSSYMVYDVPNGWFIYFDTPPKNKDVYESMAYFKFSLDDDWDMYDSGLMEENWVAALGEKPEKKFSNRPSDATR